MRRIALQLLAVAIGIAAAGVAMQLEGLTTKRLIIGAMGLAVPVVAVVTKQPKCVFLFAWVVALTYNRNYYTFDRVFGNNGSQGLYWIPADIFLVLLFGLWGWEAVIRKRVAKPIGRPTWPWLLPFFAACILSTIGAQHMSWGAFEMIRLVKFGLILYFVRFQVRRNEWWTCVAGFGFAILAQASFGALQVATQASGGLLEMFGLQGEVQELALQQERGEEWHRATGTMGHPNVLAPYLLLTAPIFMALAVTRIRAMGWALCSLIGLTGLVGLTVTLSRMAWALGIVAVTALLIGTVWLRLLSAKRAIAVAAFGSLLGGLAALPFAEKIHDRLTGDLAASLEFRTEYDRIALRMWATAPILGVGLNNFPGHLPKYDPEIDKFLEDTDRVRTRLHIRVIAAVHNLYLMLLAETGAVGLAGFGLFLIGVLIIAIRAVVLSHGAWRAVSLGMLVGIGSVLGHQITEFSLWIDPVLFSFALIVGLLNNVPVLGERQDGSRTWAEVRPSRA